MSKERLEEIKNKQNNDHLHNNIVAKFVNPPFVTLSNEDYDWLTEQAEQNIELAVAYDNSQKEIRILENKVMAVNEIVRHSEKKDEEIRRYREAIAECLTEGDFEDIHEQLERIVTTLSKALEGEE